MPNKDNSVCSSSTSSLLNETPVSVQDLNVQYTHGNSPTISAQNEHTPLVYEAQFSTPRISKTVDLDLSLISKSDSEKSTPNTSGRTRSCFLHQKSYGTSRFSAP